MLRSRAAETLLGHAAWLKLECEQVTGSFKVRGPLAVRAESIDTRPWVTASAGNHGLGVAYAMQGESKPPVVFVPRTSPKAKQRAMTSLEAEVRVVQTSHFDDAEEEALRWAAETGSRYVSAFDDDVLIAGNGGTLGLEILEQLPDLGSILVPVGGGGLIAGIACVLRALRPEVLLVGAQSKATSAMFESRRTGRALGSQKGPATFCEGLEGGVSERTFEYFERWVDDLLLVSEEDVAQAMGWLWQEHALRVEGSAAVGIAACLQAPRRLPEPTCFVLTGCNVDDETWARATGIDPHG